MSNVQPIKNQTEPDLLLQLECSEAPIKIARVECINHLEEWGDDKQKAVKIKVEFACSDPQIIPQEYVSIAEQLKGVALSGPDDKSNANRISIRHEVKRGTYRIRRKKKAPQIEFSGEPAGLSLVVDNKKTVLKWRVECIIPAGRLLDLVEMMAGDGVELTLENLQLDMWGH